MEFNGLNTVTSIYYGEISIWIGSPLAIMANLFLVQNEYCMQKTEMIQKDYSKKHFKTYFKNYFEVYFSRLLGKI